MDARALIEQMLAALETASEAYARMAPDVDSEDYDPELHGEESGEPCAHLYREVAGIDAAIAAAKAFLAANP